MNIKFQKMIRLICLLLVALLIVSALSACGENNENDKKPNDTDNNPPAEDKTPDPIPLRIGSYNIANGSKVNHDLKVLARDILEQQLDIVGLQEVDINADRSKNLDVIKELARYTGYEYYTFFKTIPLGQGEYGTAVLSKYPIVDTERIELYSEGVEDRVLGRTVIDINGTKINFFVTHVSYEDDAIRSRQLLQINAVLKRFDNFLLTGDFNTSNFEEYAVFENAATLNTAEHHLPTYELRDSIDNFVFSADDWTFEAPAVLANEHSDHSMLYAKGYFQPKK